MKFRIFYFISFTLFALSCDDSDEMGGNERALTVASFNSVQLGGNSVVRFDNSLTINQSVLIKGNPGQVGRATLEVINGALPSG